MKKSTILYIILGAVVAAVVVILILFSRESNSETSAVEDDDYTERPTRTEERACNTDLEEVPMVTAYKLKDKGDGLFVLLYEMNGKFESSNIIYTGCIATEILKTIDMDGDGNMDCFVSWSNGGNCDECSGIDLVYFDSEKDTFRQFDGVKLTSLENWEGKPSIVYIDGITMHRYAITDGELNEVETKSYDVGKVAKTFYRELMFPDGDYENREIEVEYDVDGDGEDDTLTFYHTSSHAMSFGKVMSLEAIKLSSGGLDNEALGFNYGESFSFLEHKVKGMPDVLIDNRLYRWDGSAYKSMRYNGYKLLAD